MIKRFPLEQILFIPEIIEFQKPFKYFFFKLGKMLSDLLMPCLILFHFNCFCSISQWNWNSHYNSHWNNLIFCEQWLCHICLCPMEKRLLLFHFPLFGLILVVKLINFNFESHLNILMSFDKKDMVSDLNMSYEKSLVLFNCHCLGLVSP